MPPLPDPESNGCLNRGSIALPYDGFLNVMDSRKSTAHSLNFLAGVKAPPPPDFPIGSAVDPFDISNTINHVSIRYMVNSADKRQRRRDMEDGVMGKLGLDLASDCLQVDRVIRGWWHCKKGPPPSEDVCGNRNDYLSEAIDGHEAQ